VEVRRAFEQVRRNRCQCLARKPHIRSRIVQRRFIAGI